MRVHDSTAALLSDLFDAHSAICSGIVTHWRLALGLVGIPPHALNIAHSGEESRGVVPDPQVAQVIQSRSSITVTISWELWRYSVWITPGAISVCPTIIAKARSSSIVKHCNEFVVKSIYIGAHLFAYFIPILMKADEIKNCSDFVRCQSHLHLWGSNQGKWGGLPPTL